VTVAAPVSGLVSEATYWQDQMLADNRAALTTVRTSASTWQGMLAGVLGLFGTVTLLGAPSALDEVSSRPAAYLAVGLIAAAFLAAVAAVVLVTRIITTGVRIEQTPDPATRGVQVLDAAAAATAALGRSKRLAFAGASMIAAAGLLLAVSELSGGGSGSTDAPLALVRTTSSTLCGPMSVDDSGVLSVADQAVGPTRSVEVVDSCAASEAAEPATGTAGAPYLLGLLVAAVLVGWVLAAANLWDSRYAAPAAAAAILYALAWGMSGEFFTGWHLVGMIVAAVVADWAGLRHMIGQATTSRSTPE
jgi:hypothetical protein